MLRLALLGEEVDLLHHVPHHSNDFEWCAEVLSEAAVLHGRRANLPPHPVHNIPGRTRKNSVIAPPVVVVARVVVVVVVVDDSGVIVVDDVTHLAHHWADFVCIDDGSGGLS